MNDSRIVHPNSRLLGLGALRVEAVMDGRLPAADGDWIARYARALAESTGPVGLVQLDRDGCGLRILRAHQFAPNAASRRQLEPATPHDAPGGFFELLDRCLQPGSDLAIRNLIIRVSDPLCAQGLAALADVGRWSILTGCDNVSLAGAYCTLKRISESITIGWHRRIGAMMLGSSAEEARHAHHKLNLIARPVLGRRVELIGGQLAAEPMPHATTVWLQGAAVWPRIERMIRAALTEQREGRGPVAMIGRHPAMAQPAHEPDSTPVARLSPAI